MPRYSLWRGLRLRTKDGAAVPPALLDLGKKLLGRVTGRRDTDGVKTIVEHIRLEDGSIITAGWDYDVPYIDIDYQRGEEQLGCRLYLESGLIDLGANTADSLTVPPTYADGEKTIHFGDTVDCDELGGLNGFAEFNDRQIRSQCVSDEVSSLPAMCLEPVGEPGDPGYVSRADKINAQGRIKASCFSGLMRRYVQAIYGQPQARYKLVDDYLTLLVPNSAGGFSEFPLRHDWTSGTTGLIDPEGTHDYRFVRITSTQVEVRECRFSDCGEVLHRALKSGQAGEPGEPRHDRLESFALSTAIPGDVVQVIDFGTSVTGDPIAYGWQTNGRGDEITVVTHSDSQTQRWIRALSVNDEGEIEVLEADADPDDFFMPRSIFCLGVIYGPEANGTLNRRAVNSGVSDYDESAPQSYDAIIYGYYDSEDSFIEVRVKQESVQIEYTELIDGCSSLREDDDGDDYIVVGDSGISSPDCVNARLGNTYALSIGFYTPTASSVGVSMVNFNEDESELSCPCLIQDVYWVDDLQETGTSTYSTAYYTSSGGTPPGYEVLPGEHITGQDGLSQSYGDCDVDFAAPHLVFCDWSVEGCPGFIVSAQFFGSYEQTDHLYTVEWGHGYFQTFNERTQAFAVLAGAIESVVFFTWTGDIQTGSRNHLVDEDAGLKTDFAHDPGEIQGTCIDAEEPYPVTVTFPACAGQAGSTYNDGVVLLSNLDSRFSFGDSDTSAFGVEDVSTVVEIGTLASASDTENGSVRLRTDVSGDDFEFSVRSPPCFVGDVEPSPSDVHDPVMQVNQDGDSQASWETNASQSFAYCEGRTLLAAASVGGATVHHANIHLLTPISASNLHTADKGYPRLQGFSFVGWA